MALPALLYVAVVLALQQDTAVGGWAIPTATDIAFALAVLAVFGRGLPVALRLFLMTLAVVDDLLAIIVIAVFYTETIHPLELLLALAAVAGFGVAVRLRRLRWWLLVPLALVAWALMHASGVHATIAGVLLGFTVPALGVHGEAEARTHRLAHVLQPWSTGLALPVFAFFAAGVTVASEAGPLALLGDPVLVGVVVGLVVGKVIGVLGSTALVTRLTPLRLPDSIGLRDLLPVGFLTGIGFTVSLLIAELSFPGPEHAAAAKVGVLLGTALSAVLAATLLRWDAHRARSADMNEDGVADTPGDLL
jgi:NhaA family Na+:H+ antiporter